MSFSYFFCFFFSLYRFSFIRCDILYSLFFNNNFYVLAFLFFSFLLFFFCFFVDFVIWFFLGYFFGFGVVWEFWGNQWLLFGTTTIGHNKSIVMSITIGSCLFRGARQSRKRCAKSTSGIVISYSTYTLRCQIGNCMGVEHNNRRDIMSSFG